MTFKTAEKALQGVEKEIRGEMASALGETGGRLVALLEKLSKVQIRLERADEASERGQLVREYNLLRELAQNERLKLVIQREAMGLKNHRVVEQTYSIPPVLGFKAG